MNRKVALRAGTAVGCVLAISSAMTQFIAWRLGYHPALGHPLLGHWYAPWSWIEWYNAPWAINVRETLRLALAGGIVAGALTAMAAIYIQNAARRRPVKHPGIHGTARFMTPDEVRKSGLLHDGSASPGVYVGAWTDEMGIVRYLRHVGPEHCIIIAPTRSGKGVGVIVPTLLSWSESVLVYDEKGELWQLSAGWRSQYVGRAIRWEPGAFDGSAGFNFLEEIPLGTPYEVAEAQNIAQIICDPRGDGIEGKDHWGKTSFDLLASVILHVMYVKHAKGEIASLTDVAFALSDPEEKSDTLWEQMRTNKHMNGKVHPFIASAGRDQLDRPERERGSVLSSAKTYLTLVKDPIIQKNTSRSSFHIDDLMDADDPVSLYVVTRPDNNERLRPLVRLFLTMAMHKLMGVELEYRNGQPVQPHKHKLLMTIDEFPSLGRLDVISNSLSKCAGYGIKALLAAQDREQMFRAYGQYQTITPNCHVRIVYAPNETATAEWVSKMLSKQTMTVEQITESGKKHGNLNHISRTYRDVERELMTVGEIMRIRSPKKNRKGQIVEPGGMVVFVAGDFPIGGTQLLYFMDPTFSARARIPPPERIKPQGRIWRIAA